MPGRATMVIVGLAVCAAACSKPSDGGAPKAGSSASASAAGAASGPASAAASGTATATAAAAGSASGGANVAANMPAAWRGSYRSSAAAMSVAPAWKKVHWSDPESSAGIGDGTLTLAVDAATGRVSGTLEGPLGPASIDGTVADGKLAAAVGRKDPADHGFTGTLLGTVAGDKIEGTMNVSLGQAGALRTATFALAPGGAAAGR